MKQANLTQLSQLEYTSLRFRLKALEQSHLPLFKGHLLHGVLHNALRRLVCIMNPKQPCATCPVSATCVTTRIFEPSFPGKPPDFLKGIQTPPRPYVLFCGNQHRRIATGEFLEFDLILVGLAIQYYSYMIAAVKKMAERGIGRGRHKFALVDVLFREGSKSVSFYEGDLITRKPLSASVFDSSGGYADKAMITLQSPLRLKSKSGFMTDIHLNMLARRIMRRIRSLASCYSNERQNDRSADSLPIMNEIKVVQSDLHWRPMVRYSGRQKQTMPFGGLLGSFLIEGELTRLLPLLRAAETLHVGKSTTFGYGKIRVDTNV